MKWLRLAPTRGCASDFTTICQGLKNMYIR